MRQFLSKIGFLARTPSMKFKVTLNSTRYAFFHTPIPPLPACRILEPLQDPNIEALEAKAMESIKPAAKAIQTLRVAAKKGCPKAQYYLGRSYLEGRSVEQNGPLGIMYLKIAAEKYGHQRAQSLLGRCYLEGTFVTKDETQGMHFLTIAAQKGDADALHYLRPKNEENFNAITLSAVV